MVEIEIKKKLCKSILVSIRNEWQVHHKFYHISILLFVSTFCILELYWNVKLLLPIRFFSDLFILQKSRLNLFCPPFVCLKLKLMICNYVSTNHQRAKLGMLICWWLIFLCLLNYAGSENLGEQVLLFCQNKHVFV